MSDFKEILAEEIKNNPDVVAAYLGNDEQEETVC